MIAIDRQFVEAAENAPEPAELGKLVQQAIVLEHATIPPYLTAMISLRPGGNEEIRAVLRSVVVEEMLHLTIAANIVSSLGATPRVDDRDFIPHYPGPLPMGIAQGLQVGLVPYSVDVVRDTFMAIEAPEDPLVFPTVVEEALPFATIGQFYAAVQAKVTEFGPTLPGDPARQVIGVFPPDELFPIIDAGSAVRAIDIIVRQGEGTTSSPLDPDGGFAHYYRFNELAEQRRLVVDPRVPVGFSFTGDPIPFDPSGVWPLHPNTKVADLPAGSEERHLADRFNEAYSRLLAGLQRAFDGEPSFLPTTLALMYDVRLIGEKLASFPFPGGGGETVGPPFEHVATTLPD